MGSKQGNDIYTWKVEEGQTGKHLGSFGILETASEEFRVKGDAVPAAALLLPAVQSVREAARRKSVSLKSGYIVTKDLQDWWQDFSRKEGRRKDLRLTGSARFGGPPLKLILRGATPTRLLGTVRDGNGASASPSPEEVVFNFEEVVLTY